MSDGSFERDRYYQMLLDEQLRPSAIYQQSLKITRDGNNFCVLMGENLQEGVAGFGKTLADAMSDFDMNFYKEEIKK